jgi:hypothetical protein
MKWMDIMVNITLAGDVQTQHLCEIQIVHSKMLVARKNLGGHKPYSQLRAASEILAVLRGMRARDPKSSKFSLKKLFTSPQKIAPPAAKQLRNEPAAAERCPSPPPPATPPPAPDWTAHITEEGHTYYASAITGETQWEVPASMMVVGNADGDKSGWSDNPMNHAMM